MATKSEELDPQEKLAVKGRNDMTKKQLDELFESIVKDCDQDLRVHLYETLKMLVAYSRLKTAAKRAGK